MAPLDELFDRGDLAIANAGHIAPYLQGREVEVENGLPLGLVESAAYCEIHLRLAPETGVPLVVTNDLHYVHEAQSAAQDVLLCIGTGNNIDTPDRMKFAVNAFWLKSAAQMAAGSTRASGILAFRASAAATPADCPIDMQGGISRDIFCAVSVAE